MKFPAMTSVIPSAVRRLAWTRSHRADMTAEEEDSVALIMSMSEFTFQDMDDAFLEEGCTVEMIQNWLQDCSSCSETSCEDVPYIPKVSYCKGNSLDDDFTLGAEATLLSNHNRNRISVVLDYPNLKTINLGNSMASNSTTQTSSSISEVLTLCQADAETVLYNLGFACEKTCSAYEIPSRFFVLPSKAEGINLKKYYESLLHRIKRGDSSYIPADHGLLDDIVSSLNNSYPCIRTPGKRDQPRTLGTRLNINKCTFY
ncbi:protein TESPA1 [Leptodactylus fuscus]|uniref:protein TESPA1 n=1 Tax=Leptodactylus fuscus TaxID=238119 RepID=UPI003F4F162D